MKNNYRKTLTIIFSVTQTIMVWNPDFTLFFKTFLRIPNMDIFKMSKIQNLIYFLKNICY